jgi:pimeloyl-ACP methyl ester carboxylesterase
MRIIERGRGVPLVLVPGIQGRWAYTEPAVRALAARFRVITFDLSNEHPSIEAYVNQVEAALDAAGVRRAVICGVSFGGYIALRFAAERPGRTAALVLVSPPGPGFHLKPRHLFYTRLPWLFGPVFLAEMPRRVGAELRMAMPAALERVRFSLRQLGTFFRAPVSLSRMAQRARMIGSFDTSGDCARIAAPTLVVSGEPSLDHVVAADGSTRYLQMIPGAHGVTLENTGHLGFVTRPETFASIVSQFVEACNLPLDEGRTDAA